MQENLVPFRPLNDRVIVYIYDDGMSSIDLGNGTRLITGLQDTNFDSIHDVTDGTHPGLRARWALVTAVNENTTDVKVGPDSCPFCIPRQWIFHLKKALKNKGEFF